MTLQRQRDGVVSNSHFDEVAQWVTHDPINMFSLCFASEGNGSVVQQAIMHDIYTFNDAPTYDGKISLNDMVLELDTSDKNTYAFLFDEMKLRFKKEYMSMKVNNNFETRSPSIGNYNEDKCCSHCGAETTPNWRKHNQFKLCNKCGLHFSTNNCCRLIHQRIKKCKLKKQSVKQVSAKKQSKKRKKPSKSSRKKEPRLDSTET